MKKTVTIIFALVMLLATFPYSFSAQQAPTVEAASAIVMDASTGQVLYEKNMNQKAFPASITKIMTTLLAVENVKITDVATASEDAVSSKSVPRDTTHIMLVDGEQMKVEDLLNAAMLPSANDAANVVAEYVGGSIPAFADMMNARAAELGCVSTHFTNANGLPDDNHYTTAYDMAMITKAAIQNETFRSFFSKVTYETPATNKNVARSGATTHKMLKQGEYYYESATGGKTGWTSPAKYTVVTTAMQSGRELICVLLGCEEPNQRYTETIKLFDYAFQNFQKITLSADAVLPKTVDVIKGDYKVATATYVLTQMPQFLICNDMNAGSVTVNTSVPDKINGEPGVQWITLTTDCEGMYSKIGTYTLTMTLTSLAEPVFVGAETTVKTASESSAWDIVVKVLVVIGIIVLSAAVLFIIVVIYAVVERKKRIARRRRKRQFQRQSKENFYFDDKKE